MRWELVDSSIDLSDSVMDLGIRVDSYTFVDNLTANSVMNLGICGL